MKYINEVLIVILGNSTAVLEVEQEVEQEEENVQLTYNVKPIESNAFNACKRFKEIRLQNPNRHQNQHNGIQYIVRNRP